MAAELEMAPVADEKIRIFLRYNKDNVFINLVQAEDHFRNLRDGADPGWMNCIAKHLAFVEGEASEAQSHSLILEGEEASRRWAAFRDEVRRLRRRMQAGEVRTPEEGIREVRRLRRLFESFNPEYDISRCESCGEAALKAVERLRYGAGYMEMEREYAERIIRELSARYGVPEPELEIVDSCNDPKIGLHTCDLNSQKGKITICAGNANMHVLFHEFAHHLQCHGRLPQGEREAEEWAIHELGKTREGCFTPLRAEKTYNEENIHGFGGKRIMALTWRETGLIVGGQHIFKGFEKAFDYIDGVMGKASAGVWERPSTLINTIGGVILMVLPRFVRMPGVVDLLLTVGGGHMTTKVWDYLEEYMPAVGTAAYAPAAMARAPAPIVSAPAAPAAPAGRMAPVF